MSGWAVETVEDFGRAAYYRYRVSGWNRYTGEKFSWRVPNLDCASYDLSGAFFREPSQKSEASNG